MNLKYKTLGETLTAHIAEWVDEEWMRIELYKFMNHHQNYDFEIILKRLSNYTCSSAPILIEGITFQAIENVSLYNISNYVQN